MVSHTLSVCTAYRKAFSILSLKIGYVHQSSHVILYVGMLQMAHGTRVTHRRDAQLEASRVQQTQVLVSNAPLEERPRASLPSLLPRFGMPPLTAAAVQAILTGEPTSSQWLGAEGQLGQFSSSVLRDCKVVSCEPRRLVVTLPVTARITNSSFNLHGGASCTLVDTLSAARQLVGTRHT